MRVLFVSKNKKADKFLKWATKTLFTVQMGTKAQKDKLVSKVLGVPDENVAEVFNRGSTKTPCIYFFTLGYAKDLRKSMNISKDYSDDMIVGKFGFAKDLARRTGEHSKDFGKIKGCELSLKYYSYIDPQYISQAETDLKRYFKDLDAFFKYEKKEELVIISKKDIVNIEKSYLELGCRYAGHIVELVIKLREKDHELELLRKDMELMKKDMKIKEFELEKKNALLNKKLNKI